MTSSAPLAKASTGLEPGKIFDFDTPVSGILIAVSGGPDSMALLGLAAEWAKAPRGPPLAAATFDHDLRPGSADEAQIVKIVCERLGIPHTTLKWRGEKPRTRIQETARAKRYEALAEHAKTLGFSHLLTAHHADDQAETILFRLMRGSGIAGLAGMQRVVKRNGIVHARPLLHIAKVELVAYCVAHGLPFVDDPSNIDPRFARTRMRALAAALAHDGMSANDFARFAARAARAEEALVFAARRLRASLNVRSVPGGVEFDAHPLAEAPAELMLRTVMDEITRLGRAPRLERVESLADDLRDSILTGRTLRRTLGGTLVTLDADGRLQISLEKPRTSPPRPRS